MGNCSNCGAELKQGAAFCSNCGAAQAEVVPAETFEPEAAAPAGSASAGWSAGGTYTAAPAPPLVNRAVPPKKIEDHLVKSIIATVCCCVPFGVVGIVYATQVGTLLRKGDRAAAEEASRKAGLWSTLAIGIGVVLNALAFALTLIYEFKAVL